MNENPTNEQVLMQVVQTFLQRTNLKGGEVDSYAKCFNFVQTIAEGTNVVVPAELFQEGLDAVQTLATQQKDSAVKQGNDALEGAGLAPEIKDIPVLEQDSNAGEEMISEGSPLPALEEV